MMRLAAAIAVLACSGQAQFRSTVPLVVAPTSITDSKGRYVDGLTAEDLITTTMCRSRYTWTG
jgi:hypothetical protein